MIVLSSLFSSAELIKIVWALLEYGKHNSTRFAFILSKIYLECVWWFLSFKTLNLSKDSLADKYVLIANIYSTNNRLFFNISLIAPRY